MSGIEAVLMEIIPSTFGRWFESELDIDLSREKLLGDVLDISCSIPRLSDYESLSDILSQENYSKLEAKFEDVYGVAWIQVGRECNLRYMANLVENGSEKKDISGNLVQIGYKAFLENGDVENYFYLKAVTGVEPDFDEGEKIDRACCDIIAKNDYVGISRIIEVMDDISNDLIQKLYRSCIELRQPQIVDEIKRTLVRKEGNFDLEPNFDEGFVNDQYEKLFQEDWELYGNDPYGTLLDLRNLSNIVPDENIVQSAYQMCVDNKDAKRLCLIYSLFDIGFKIFGDQKRKIIDNLGEWKHFDAYGERVVQMFNSM
jgi:hypothetical protein